MLSPTPNRLQTIGYSLAVVGVALISTAAILLRSLSHPAAGLWWDLLIAGLTLLMVSVAAIALLPSSWLTGSWVGAPGSPGGA